MSRPQGTPGRVPYADDPAESLPAIRDRDGLVWAEVGAGWVSANHRYGVTLEQWAEAFEPDPDVPEWVPRCPHPTICDTETDCTRLLREEPRDD